MTTIRALWRFLLDQPSLAEVAAFLFVIVLAANAAGLFGD
jgi:hypothetical protein